MFRNGFNDNPMKRLRMWEIMFVGFRHLQTLFGTYEQFIAVLWNFLFIGNVRKTSYGTAPRKPREVAVRVDVWC